MTEGIDMGLTARGEADVEYGPYRLKVARWAGKDPDDVTNVDIHLYETACEEEGRQP